MSYYKKIDTNNYCVDELECVCEKCKKVFFDYVPSNYELVCFLLESGEKRFLPTYGKYGYLDLMNKLLDNWKPTDKISMAISNEFESKIQNIIPYKVVLFDKVECPSCGSYDIKVIRRTLKKNPKLSWLEIDKQLLD